MFQGFTTQCACGEKLVRKAVSHGEPRCERCKKRRKRELSKRKYKILSTRRQKN